MRAVSFQGPHRLKVVDKPDPRIEHPQDVVLKVTAAGICGSDLHLLHGLVPDTRVGCTFGHEFTGVVEETGPDVHALQPGDRVVVPFNVACGGCEPCRRGRFSLCENATPSTDLMGGAFGYSHLGGGYEGGQAQYVRVPYADFGPMKIPDGMGDEQVLLLSDVFPTGYQAAQMAGVAGGETVVVFGAGPVGLMAMRSCWLLGAERVIAVDQVGYRLAFAQRWAGVETVDFGAVDDVVRTVRELTGGKGPDACIDAVGCEAEGSRVDRLTGLVLKVQAGTSTALDWAIQAVKKGGTVSVVGAYGPPFNRVPLGAAMNKGLTLRLGQCDVRRHLPLLLEHLEEGRVNPAELITHRLPLDQAPHAYELFAKKKDGCIKCVLLPHAVA